MSWSIDDAERVEVTTPASDSNHDLEELTRPLLEALAKLAALESTYLTVFDWDRREQEVRFVHGGDLGIVEGSRLPLPEGASRESLPGVTRSPEEIPSSHPDSQAARGLGLQTYVSVPIVLAKHELLGMVCGASRQPQPVSEAVVSVMEFFAEIVADHVSRARLATAEQRAATAEAQLQARARFVAMAEHQMKTPVTSLLGAAQILHTDWDRLDGVDRSRLLDLVMRAARELSGRLTGLLVEARADLQSRELVPVEVDLVGFLEVATRAFAAATPDHPVEAEVDEGLTVMADPTALQQVVGHLLDNAAKYSPPGSLISVTGRRTSHGVTLAVADEGVGMPDDVDVFQPFQRGDHNQVGIAPGVGLGLHIVRNLVEAMGGSVGARSNPGRGATVTISLSDDG